RVAFRVDAEDDERRPPGRTQPLQDEGEVTTFDRTLGMTPRVEEGQEHGPSPKRGEREARAALVAERELRRGPLPGWPAGLAVERRRGFRAARATQLVQRDAAPDSRRCRRAREERREPQGHPGVLPARVGGPAQSVLPLRAPGERRRSSSAQ